MYINVGWLIIALISFLIVVSFLSQTIMLLIAIFSTFKKVYNIIKNRIRGKTIVVKPPISLDEGSIDSLINKIKGVVKEKVDVEYKFSQIVIECKKFKTKKN